MKFSIPLILLFCCLVPIEELAGQNIDTLKAKANKYYKLGDFSEARDLYDSIYQHYKKIDQDSASNYYYHWLKTENKFIQTDVQQLVQDYLADHDVEKMDKELIFKLKLESCLYLTNYGDTQGVLALKDKLLSFYRLHSLECISELAALYGMTNYAYTLMGNVDSAEHYGLKKIELLEENQMTNHEEYGYSFYTMGNLYSQYGNLETADSFYQKALDVLVDILPSDHPNLGIIYYVYCIDLMELGKYDEARNMGYAATDIMKKKKMHKNLAHAFMNLSKLESMADNMETYKLYLDKAHSILDTTDGFPSFAMSYVYDGYSGYLIDEKEDYKGALNYQRAALRHKLALYQGADPSLMKSYFNVGVIKILMNELDSAEYYFDIVESMNAELELDEKSDDIVHVMIERAKILQARGRYREAKDLYLKAIKNYTDKYFIMHDFVVQGYEGVFVCLDSLEQKDSLIYYREKVATPFLEQPEYVNSVAGLSVVLEYIKQVLLNAPSQGNLKTLLRKIKNINFSQWDRQQMVIDRQDIFLFRELYSDLLGYCVQANIEMYKLEGKKQYKFEALKLEKYQKSNSIFLRISNDEIFKLARIPDAEIDAYARLRDEAKYLNMVTEGSNSYQPSNLDQRKIDLKAEWNKWERRNPVFSEFKKSIDQDNDQSLEQLNQWLCDNNTSILSISILDENYVGMITNCSNIDWLKIGSVKEINALIKNYNELLKQNDSIEEIEEIGFQIYKNLIHPFNKFFEEKLVVIPAGILQHFNIEALPSSVINASTYSEMEWLVNKIEIQYALNIPEVSTVSRNDENQLLIVAPGFKQGKNKNALSRTPWTSQFCEKLAKERRGILLSNEKANYDDVISMMPQSSIIHFGTHAILDTINALQSKLMLSDSKHLTYEDIFKLPLKSRMVVLAGCETGLGQRESEHENLSLANAFHYAGNKKLIQSLWKIDDQSTNKILSKFYDEYVTSQNSSRALHFAKLEYLNQAEGSFASPYYWAGLVLTTTDFEIVEEYNLSWYWILLLIIPLSFIIFRRKST